MSPLGFVGLGVMGSRMARRLLDAGHAVQGYNRNREKADPLVALGMTRAGSPRAPAEGAEVVVSIVTPTAALNAGRLGALAEAQGAALLDAPVSGGPGTVEQGQLSIYVGGESAALERVRPYLEALGPTITRGGPPRGATPMKTPTTPAAPVQWLGFAESGPLAEKGGTARGAAVEAILRSVMASPMLR